MAPYPNNTFYDPVGSQSHQPSGYTYANNTQQFPSQNTAYPSSSYLQNYGTSYDNQYASHAQQQPQQSANTEAAAAGLSSLNGQGYTLPSPSGVSRSNVAYETSNSTWAQSYSTNTYNASINRTQANESPVYATQASGSTFGRLSLPDQTQTNTYAASQNYQTVPSTQAPQNSANGSYRNAPNSAGYKSNYQATQQQTSTQQPPPRYASPLHALQAQLQQATHTKQQSRTSNQAEPSPRLAAQNLQQQRQQSASVEPMPTTVDPSQVYDMRAEREKAARVEAEKRRKIEAEQAAKKAEEDARQAEDDARKAEEERLAAEAQKASELEAQKKATAERKKEARRKAQEEKQSSCAASALQQMASGGSMMETMSSMMGNMSGPPANDEEAEIRAMFKKMREFNAKNPAMLAKLWEEERTQHAAPTSASPGTAQPAQPVQQPAPQLTKKQQKAAATPANSAPPAQPPVPALNRPALALPTKPVQASHSTSSQAGTALWPPQKKGSLAEAAAKWLSALPENRTTGRTIGREQVLRILDSNPSYVQLCEAVETIGIRFERSALAKELLKAVPDGMRTGQSAAKAVPTAVPPATAQAFGPSAPGSAPSKKKGRPKKDEPGRYSLPGGRALSSGTVSYSAPTFTSLTGAAREANAMTTGAGLFGGTASSTINAYAPAAQDPTFYQSEPIMIDDDRPEVKPEEKPEEPRTLPKDKEEAARKRGFGDLVDLTATDSEDDEGPPRKVFVPFGGPSNGVKPTRSNDTLRQPMTYQQFLQNKNSQPAAPFSSGYGLGAAQPAFLQQTWNGPKVLPNAPAPPPCQQPRPKGPSEEHKQAERIRGKMLVEPIMRDRVARKSKYDSRTIARDVLLATGRHPDMRALNSHLNVMQKMLGDHGGVVDGSGNKSDLSTIRWDLIDPGEPTEDAKLKAKSALSHGEDGGAQDSSHDTDHASYAKRKRLAGPEGRKKASVGRPRKSKADRDSSFHNASVDTTNPDLIASDLSNPRRTPPSMPRASTLQPTGTPIGYAAFRQLDENGNTIKKKGRPVGWRKNVHSREAQGLTPKKSGTYELKTASKLRQSTAAQKPPKIVEPHYQVFPCKWKGCNAELDNLDKLKKHALKLHGTANGDGDFECRWQECGNGVHIDAHGNERSGDAGVTSFETLDHWLKHVDSAHLQEVAWKLGDGPRGGSVSETRNNSAAYLSDASGRSVTPIILTPQEFAQQQKAQAEVEAANNAEAGIVAMEDLKLQSSAPQSVTKRKPGQPPRYQEAFGLQSLSLPKHEREAAAELQKLEEQKRREGVTMGLEGSRLVNEKRRRGFLDDEDFEDMIEDSEPGV